MTPATPDDRPGDRPEALPATCPSCGAVVRQSVPWCLQCYASLRPERVAAPAAQEEPAGQTLPPSRSPADVEGQAERMLAQLRAGEAADARWALPSSRGARAGAVLAVVVVLVLVFVLVLTVLGSLL